MNTITVSAKTVDEAITEACVQLGLTSTSIEVEVIESDYAFGEYWVITPDDIPYTDKDGVAVSRADLKPGDKIEITYSGQVMMSYPPQIVAKAIKLR